MSKEAQELQFDKNTLYRDHYRVALGGALLMTIICAVLAATLAMMSLFPPQPKYYATTTTGVIVPLHSLSEPVVTKSYLLQWASLAAQRSYNLDFNDYKSQIQAENPYFTTDGFNKYQQALKDSGLLDQVVQKKLVMNAIVSGDAVIIKEYIQSGRHTWVVQLPLLVTFQSASDTRRVHMMVTLRIQRVPVLDAENGIQITDYAVG
jgi:intracellular multiplication protein IcmL